MQRFDPEAVDLRVLAQKLASDLGSVVTGAVVGRTRLRDAVVRDLACSLLEAEQVVDTMVGRGFLRMEEPASGLIWWRIVSDP